MSTIKLLPQDVIAQIAAGQVIERPASVVKELIENALDAEARHIVIALRNSGLDSIVVADDGVGMSKEDLQKCYLPHTTSKIASSDDLLGLDSFGFRGEALASIAAVGTVTIASKQKEAVGGWKVTINSGKQDEVQPVGMPDGTRIEVERLFAFVPARKKFMKTRSTELRQCIDVVSAFALIHEDVSFELSHNGSDLLRTNSYQSPVERVSAIVSDSFASSSVPIDYADEHVRIVGFIGNPDVSLSSERHQYMSINKRPVKNTELRKAVKKGYGTLMEPRAYPQCVIHIEYPTEMLDVNVDPRKETVRFQKPVHTLLQQAVEEALSISDATYTSSAVRDMDPELGDHLKERSHGWTVKNIDESEIAQLHNVYLVLEDRDGMLLIDQHAAHERILFEEFAEVYRQERQKGTAYELPAPAVVKLSSADALILDEHMEDFTKLGFRIEAFGECQYKIEAVPVVFKSRSIPELIQDMLDDVSSDMEVEFDNKTHRTLTYLACRSSIMAGDALTMKERKRLVKKLFECDTPYTCPHGRPTMVRTTRKELDRMFKRS